MNAIVTLNHNNVLTNNARQSIIAASERWKCEYVEFKRLKWEDHHPCFSKIAFLAERVADWDRVAYFDADMLIRSDAPSPFDHCPIGKVGGVTDLQDHYTDELRKTVDLTVHRKHIAMLQQLNIIGELTKSEDEYFKCPFNGGFLVTTPSVHARIFKHATDVIETFVKWDREHGNHYQWSGHTEQAFLNWILESSDMKYPMHNTWNRIGVDLTYPYMKDYVYHFTGMDFGDKRHAIRYFPWKHRYD